MHDSKLKFSFFNYYTFLEKIQKEFLNSFKFKRQNLKNWHPTFSEKSFVNSMLKTAWLGVTLKYKKTDMRRSGSVISSQENI